MNDRDDKIKELEKRIAALKKQWPAHSVSATMLQQLEDLEEELDQVRAGATKEETGENKAAGE